MLFYDLKSLVSRDRPNKWTYLSTLGDGDLHTTEIADELPIKRGKAMETTCFMHYKKIRF